jgi:hypothetical protein
MWLSPVKMSCCSEKSFTSLTAISSPSFFAHRPLGGQDRRHTVDVSLGIQHLRAIEDFGMRRRCGSASGGRRFASSARHERRGEQRRRDAADKKMGVGSQETPE